MSDLPQSPVNPLEQEAITLFEIMRTYENAGFTHDEAFELVRLVQNARYHGEVTR